MWSGSLPDLSAVCSSVHKGNEREADEGGLPYQERRLALEHRGQRLDRLPRQVGRVPTVEKRMEHPCWKRRVSVGVVVQSRSSGGR